MKTYRGAQPPRITRIAWRMISLETSRAPLPVTSSNRSPTDLRGESKGSGVRCKAERPLLVSTTCMKSSPPEVPSPCRR